MKKIITSKNAPAPVGAYNQAVSFNGMVFISGQIAINPQSGDLVLSDIESETTQVMENIKAILTEAGLTFEHVLKCSIFATDMNNFGKINGVYSKYFNEDTAPAREFVEVRNLPKFVNVEISVIAAEA